MPVIDGLVMRRPNLIEAVRRLGLVGPDTPVFDAADDPQLVTGMVLLGSVPPRCARYARLIAEPVIRVSLGERDGELPVEEIMSRYEGLRWFRVEGLGWPPEPAEIIATRHEGLAEFIRTEGLATPDAPVEPHAQREHVEGKHAAGILPYRIAVAARLVTNVPMAIPVEREWDELTLEEQWQYLAGVPFAYRVHHVENPDA